MAGETTAAGLDIRSNVTGKGDGYGVRLAGGGELAQQQARDLGTTPDDLVQSARATLTFKSQPLATTAAAMASRGVRRPSTKQLTNVDAVKFGREVMGQEEWNTYITTSCTLMVPMQKPLPCHGTRDISRNRDSRLGWTFRPVPQSGVDNEQHDHLYLTCPHQRHSITAH